MGRWSKKSHRFFDRRPIKILGIFLQAWVTLSPEYVPYIVKPMLRKPLYSLPVLLFAAGLFAQAPPAPSNDGLLDKMVGRWSLTGPVAGQQAHHDIEAAWALNHQFLRIHEQANAKEGDRGGYEAWVFVGYDAKKQQYVAHWLDVFGGGGADAVGLGRREGDAIVFTFNYAGGAFETTFRWNPADRTWQWLMRSRDSSGQWKEFGKMTLRRK